MNQETSLELGRPQRFDVAVVGAGLSGLTCAWRLSAAGASVLVLEAQPRVGGRALTHPLKGEAVAELGGQWIGPQQHRVLALLQEMGLETHPTRAIGEHLQWENGRLTRTKDLLGNLGVLNGIGLWMGVRRLEQLSSSMDPWQPWAHARSAEWDWTSLGAWIEANVMGQPAKAALKAIAQGSFGMPAGQVSLLYALHHFRTCESISVMTDIKAGALQRRIAGGPGALCDALANRLSGRIRCSEPVWTVRQNPDSVTLELDAGKVEARRVVVAVDPGAAGRISFIPPLPTARQNLQRDWLMGKGIKAAAVYAKPFWREDGLSGMCTTDRAVASFVFDNSPPDASVGVLGVFSDAGTPAVHRREAVLQTLTSCFGEQAAAPLSYIEKDWGSDDWASGCVSGPRLGVLSALGPALRAPVGRVYWAGAETAASWDGHFEGAVAAGEEAAQACLKADVDEGCTCKEGQ